MEDLDHIVEVGLEAYEESLPDAPHPAQARRAAYIRMGRETSDQRVLAAAKRRLRKETA